MSNRVSAGLVAVLSLCVAFAYGSSLAAAQSTQEVTTAPATQEETAASSAAKNEKGKGGKNKKGKGGKNKKGKGGRNGDEYQKNFPKEPFINTGENPYFILQPGYVLELAGEEDKEKIDLTITVTNETEVVDGVLTRVVEEREEKDGTLYEVSRNYFVLGARTNNAYYFGEDVDFYNKKGEVISHEGSWRSGVDGARYGLQMPGEVRVGQRYYQEVAPKVALDRAEHVSKTADVNTPAGRFRNTLKVRETTPLEPKIEEFKFHAKRVGLVKDGAVRLVRYGYLGS